MLKPVAATPTPPAENPPELALLAENPPALAPAEKGDPKDTLLPEPKRSNNIRNTALVKWDDLLHLKNKNP